MVNRKPTREAIGKNRPDSQGPASVPMLAAPHPHELYVNRSRRNRKDVWKRRTRLLPLPASGSSVYRCMRPRPVRNRTVTWHLPPMPYRATELGFGSPNFCPSSSPWDPRRSSLHICWSGTRREVGSGKGRKPHSRDGPFTLHAFERQRSVVAPDDALREA